jgi:hypothetical protein
VRHRVSSSLHADPSVDGDSKSGTYRDTIIVLVPDSLSLQLSLV